MSLIKGIYRNMSKNSLKFTAEIKRTDCLWFGVDGSVGFKYLSYYFCIEVLMGTNFYGITSGNNKKYCILECYF